MVNRAAELVQLRNEFYKDNYRRVLMVLLFSMIVIISLSGMLYYLVSHPPQPKYFPTSIDGRVTPLQPLSKPYQSSASVLQWATQAVVAGYTYNYVNYRQELQAASDFFTPHGWTQFLAALQNSNNLLAVKQRQWVVSAVPTQAPTMLNQGVKEGRYFWKIQLPIIVTYHGRQQAQVPLKVILTIVRISAINSPRGIGISQFVPIPLKS